MTAIEIREPGPPQVLRAARRPVPQPKAGEVLIKVAAAGVNRPDVLQRKGAYPPPPGASDIPGLEVAGVVVAAGEGVSEPAVGARVCALLAGGGYAEYATAPAVQCLPAPTQLTLDEAAAVPETFFTVWLNVFERARLRAGETLLCHGGASGIGTTAILMAKAIGARVLTTVGSDEKMVAVKALGADHVLNYRKDRFETWARRLTGKKGVEVVFEHVGPDTWAGSLLSLKRGGRLVTCGSTSGISAETNLFHLFQQQIRITASFGATVRNLAESMHKMAIGEALPVIDSEIPLADFDKGLKRMADRAVIGKIIVHIP